MEVFSLLKLKKSGGDHPIGLCFSPEKKQVGGGAIDDEGPFFDLEFSLPVELRMNTFMCHRPSFSSASLAEQLLFNGRFLNCLESSSSPSSLFFSPAASEPNSKPPFPASVIKSATKLRVFMSPSSSNNCSDSPSTSTKFIREDKKLIYKDLILRCFSKIKPLYVKVSKLRFSGPTDPNKAGSAAQSAVSKKQGKAKSLLTGNNKLSYKLKVVPVRLRKSRSASSAVAHVCSPPPMVTPKRDDSLLQQEDGIQGAIAHCKRSFHSEKGFWASESPLVRSLSDPGEDRSIVRGRNNSAIC